MSKIISLLLLVSTSVALYSQGIGKISVNFKDPSRSGGFDIGGAPDFPSGASGRDIGTEIYYPATSSGNNTPIVPGNYPVIVFGHGFQMVWSAYENIWEDIVPRGYIMVFPRTEGGLAPAHADFGEDIRLIETLVQQMNTTPGNILNGNISPNSAFMGHSMGGGSIYLAAENNTSPTLKTVIGLAPAETNPSAVSAAANVSVDVLVLSGSEDGVTPPSDHHELIYNAISNDCKYFFSLLGAGHCRFANNNFQCNFGETFSGGAGSLSRARVHELTSTIVNPWLDFKLKGSCASWVDFQDVIANEPDLAVIDDCGHEVIPNVSITPTGQVNTCASDSVDLEYSPVNNNFSYVWYKDNTTTGLSATPYSVNSSGNYYVQATSAFNCSTNSNTAALIFDQLVTPVFNLPTELCSSSAAPSLPSTSVNGISGTWNPSTIDNVNDGTYLFTPDAGECATTYTHVIDIATNNIEPTFTPIPAICFGSVAPVLPVTSLENFTGTWNPSVIDNTQSATYTFTPDQGQCAIEAQLEVIVKETQRDTVSYTLCQGDSFQLSNGNFVSNSGDYNDTILDVDGCDSIYRFTNIEVVPEIDIMIINNNEFQTGGVDFISEYSFQTGAMYDSIFWSSNQDIFDGSENNETLLLTHSNSSNIEITLELYVGNCSGSDNLTYFFQPNSVSTILNQKPLNIYPNPTNNMLYIEFEKSQNIEVSIFNILGKMVFKGNMSKQNNEIDVSNLSNGMYTIISEVGAAKFIKSK